MAEAVKVVVRCRPMNEREKNLKCLAVVNIDNKIAQCSLTNPNEKKGPPKNFTFDGAYGLDSTTEQIYADIGYPLVEGVTEGYNGTIFAYGQTGCGKSFSMQGIVDPPTQRGIIPRAFDHIFETIQVSAGAKYLVHSSYLEIYNEEIRDLLGKDVKAKLDLKEHPDRGVYVQGLSMVPCKNVRECHHIMDRGWKNRSTGATLMNADSSRSHSIFSIHLERCEEDETGEEHIRAAKLNLVDLAGSERQAKTGSTGDRLKEATKINLSLSALGNVISALVDGKSKHIPYRDSKLTRLLQDSLGGNTKTLMVACLSPADNNYDETLSTLRYANRAKNIKNKPKINEDPKDALLREYQDEINKLKAMLRGEIPIELEGGAGGHASAAKSKVQTKVVEKIVHVGGKELEEEKEYIRQEYEQKMLDMKNDFDKMRMNKEQLEVEMASLRDQYDQDMSIIDTSVRSPGEGESEDGTTADENDDEGQWSKIPKREVLAAATAAKVGKSPRRKSKKKIEKLNKIDEHGEEIPDSESVDSSDTASVVTLEDAIINHEALKDEKFLVMLEKQKELESKMQRQLQEIELLKSQNDQRGEAEGGADLMSVTSAEDVQDTQAVDSDSEYYMDPSDADYLVRPDAQQAVHLNTVRKRGEEGTAAPRSSPTGEHRQDALAHDEALRRLEELQQAMVGGEQANNEEVKERRRKKKKYAEERNEKLREALAQKDGEDIMLDIFDSTQVDLVKQRKALEKQKQKNEALQQEILDLQSEFEFDRIDYLDTIRKQERQMSWMQAVIDRIHPCLRRDCNYMNMDKVKMQSEWDEDGQCWNLPKMTIEKSMLPAAPPGVVPGGRQEQLKQNGDIHPNMYDELRSEDRYLEKLNRNTEQSSITKDYFKPKRAERLLKNGQDDRYRGTSTSPNNYPVTNGYSRSGSATKQPVGAWQSESMSENLELRAAAVHGQITNDDALVRKPMRLESLQAVPLRSAKKKKKHYNLEQL